MKNKKLIILDLLLVLLVLNLSVHAYAEDAIPTDASVNAAASVSLDLNCKSAVLMEAETGTVLYDQNGSVPLPPASVTKIMTLLLVMEAIDNGALSYDTVLSASANAASMGGSQIFLEPGEEMTVRDLVKSVVISSANDAAVVLAESVAGSEDAFVSMMNKKAEELGMKNSHFENTNGLDDTVTNHVLSAIDIAIMSRELIRHKEILEFSSTWMDTVRNGEFGLSNTNRLIRSYKGCNGLKTGSTSKALFCISATAEREGMTLIAVIMASPSRDVRNSAAAALLDWGFANYSLFRYPGGESGDVEVKGGKSRTVKSEFGDFYSVVPKGKSGKVVVQNDMAEYLSAPFDKGSGAGRITFTLDGKIIGEIPVKTCDGVEKLTFADLLWRMIKCFCMS